MAHSPRIASSSSYATPGTPDTRRGSPARKWLPPGTLRALAVWSIPGFVKRPAQHLPQRDGAFAERFDAGQEIQESQGSFPLGLEVGGIPGAPHAGGAEEQQRAPQVVPR